MAKKEFHTIEGDPVGVMWYVPEVTTSDPVAYCKDHLIPFSTYPSGSRYEKWLICPHDSQTYILRNRLDIHKAYVKHMSNRENIKDYKVVRIEASGNKVLAKEKYEKDPRYFIETKLSDTPKGLEIMIQVGKRDEKGNKVQLFVTPPTQRMGFDISNKDIHPSGIFTEVTARFRDSKTTIKTTGANKNKKRPLGS